jgi:hypothetical protein
MTVTQEAGHGKAAEEAGEVTSAGRTFAPLNLDTLFVTYSVF